jgi:T-complex protein 1 subunit delta
MPIDITDRKTLTECIETSLSSKIVSAYAQLLPLAVEAVMHVIDINTAINLDLRDIKIVKKLGGTIDYT